MRTRHAATQNEVTIDRGLAQDTRSAFALQLVATSKADGHSHPGLRAIRLQPGARREVAIERRPAQQARSAWQSVATSKADGPSHRGLRAIGRQPGGTRREVAIDRRLAHCTRSAFALQSVATSRADGSNHRGLRTIWRQPGGTQPEVTVERRPVQYARSARQPVATSRAGGSNHRGLRAPWRQPGGKRREVAIERRPARQVRAVTNRDLRTAVCARLMAMRLLQSDSRLDVVIGCGLAQCHAVDPRLTFRRAVN